MYAILTFLSPPIPVPQSTPPTPREFDPRDAIAAIVLLGVSLAVFAQVVGHGFLEWDDPEYVTRHSLVQGGLTWDAFVRVWTLIHASNWHPLTWLSHMLDVSLWGAWAGGHHLSSVFWHAAASLLFFGFLVSTTGDRPRSLLAAALFAIHPLHVESVVWISERKDVLSAFFWFATLVLYTHYVRGPSRLRYGMTLACFALGLMAKPMLVSLPLVLLLIDVWPLQRIGSAGHPLARMATWWPLIREKIPLLTLSLLSAIITLVAQQSAIATAADLTLTERLGTALMATATYVWQTFWPVNLSFFYPPFALNATDLARGALTLGGLVVWAIAGSRTGPTAIVGILWFVVTLLPVIGLVKVGLQAHADRYTYLPHAGFFIALLWGVRVPGPAALWRCLAVAALGTLSILAWQQTRLWTSGDRLFASAIQKRPDNYVALVQWGETRFRAGDLETASEFAQRALAVSPAAHTQMHGHQLLGNIAMLRGEFPAAVDHYTQALSAMPNSALLHYNRATALMIQGNDPAASADLQQAIALWPGYSAAYTNMGVIRQRQGDVPGAIAAYRQALTADPNNADARLNLARRLAAQGDRDQALRELAELLRRHPGHQGAGVLQKILGQAAQ